MTKDEPNGNRASLEILERKLGRERRARARAEALLEEKSSELYQTLEKLTAESAVNRELIDAMGVASDGIAITNSEGVFTYMNPAHAQLFGYEADELIGRPWSDLYEPFWIQFIADEAMPVLQSAGSWRGEAEGLAKDGSVVEQEVVLTARPDGSGLICVTRDAGPRRRRQNRIRRLEQELRESDQAAALYALNSAIAHDLGNLLGIIDGYAILIENALEKGLEKERAGKILKAGEAAKDILATLGEDAARTKSTPQDLNVSSLIHELMDLIEAIRPPQVKVSTDITSDAVVLASDVLLSRCILNVAKNAFEVMGGQGEFSVRLCKERSRPFKMTDQSARLGPPVDNPQWIIEMQDTGPGFPAGELSNLFLPFATTKKTASLSGLGLASIGVLADSKHASIEIDSRPGIGTIIRILFAEPENLPEQFSRPYKEPPSSPRVLLVEDDRESGEVTRSVLEISGYQVSLLTDSQLAADTLCQGLAVDVVITDLNMPGLSGEDLVRQTRAARPELPFILLTARPDDIHSPKLFDRVLRKPADRSEMQSAIAAALEHR